MLPFNTSTFSNTLAASDQAAQCKAIITPFKEEFARIHDVLQHIVTFYHSCLETGVIEDLCFY
jgi:hypothetical protein